ncbi:MAG: hypothetical protein WEB62_04245 [Bacteroidota bacterium]
MKCCRPLLVLLLASRILNGQTFDAGGYGKYLFSHSSIPSMGSLDDHGLHGRLNTRLYLTTTVTAALEIRARAYYGDAVRRTPQFASAIRSPRELEGLDLFLWESASSVGYAEVDRFWAEWTMENLQITAGRQRIALGTNLVWNPIDLFNPYSILDFDYAERPGSDAVRMQYFLGPLSKIDAAFKPGRTSSRSTAFLSWTGNAFDYDVHVVTGLRGKAWMGGGAWAGDIGGGGFRGEILISERPETEAPFPIYPDAAAGGMVSCAVSGDYTFPNSLYLHVEVLYNTEGVTTDAAAFRDAAAALGLLSPARWSLFGELSYSLTPLVRASLFAIQNPSDASRVVVPSVTWSALESIDLTLIGLLFDGVPSTEFGGYGASMYARVAWAF